jgi:hypothetical protein
MIFQDPMTSLNPYLRISDQMTEVLMHHEGMSRRDALTESVTRLAKLEDEARALLDKIDRTARLNPVLAPSETSEIMPRDVSDPSLPSGVVALPFDALPKSEVPGTLNWTAVVHALSKGQAAVGVRKLVDRTKADPKIAALLALRERVVRGLAEDDLHVADLTPEHSTADLWADFARGARGGEITMLAGIDDKVALSVTRARLRSDAAFRETALRFVDTYIAMLGRAVQTIGADPRLVELADTETGRVFMLLAPLTGALLPSAELPVSADG